MSSLHVKSIEQKNEGGRKQNNYMSTLSSLLLYVINILLFQQIHSTIFGFHIINDIELTDFWDTMLCTSVVWQMDVNISKELTTFSEHPE
jgi:hypothetical protein